MSPWPKPRVVGLAAAGVLAEIVTSPVGPVRGVRSADPNVLYAVGPAVPMHLKSSGNRFAICNRCPKLEPEPKMPKGVEGGPGTAAHALFVLTWLHEFSRAHRDCAPQEGTA